MSLNDTPSGERAHIVFFGVRNAGKSSLVNAVTGQAAAVVSPVAGTTTDPVRKAMELQPAGPVLMVDTPGIDDAGAVGELRTQRARQALDEADVAVLVVDAARGLSPFDEELLAAFRERAIPFVVAWNKADLLPEEEGGLPGGVEGTQVAVSALSGEGVGQLKDLLAKVITGAGRAGRAPTGGTASAATAGDSAAPAAPIVVERHLVADLLEAGDVVVLVVPLDSGAPKGRLILPQQQVIRDVLDAGAFPCATTVEMLPALLRKLAAPPRLVVTDSQVFGAVDRLVPPEVPLTSFSILMARYKGNLADQLAAVEALRTLTDEDTVLISEGCTHHRQCEDIGTVKLPAWIRQICGAHPKFAFASGRDFPQDLSPYAAVVHCGGCTLTAREMESRLQRAAQQGVPMTNYGMTIACAHNILPRALAPLRQGLR